MRNTLRAGAAALALFTAVGCGDDGGGSGSPSGSQPTGAGGVVEVKGLESLRFDPTTLSATKGQEFKGRLVQVGSAPHDIKIDAFGVDPEKTRVLKDGDGKDFSFTPDRTGTFEYVCTIHPGTMKGTLTVS